MVVHTEVMRDALTEPDPKGKRAYYTAGIETGWQLAQGEVKGDCDESAERARRKPGEPAAETECEKMAPAAKYFRIDGRHRFFSGQCKLPSG
jgi:hypothetical protein